MRFFRTPRPLLYLEGLLLVGALIVLAYKAATRIQPLPAESIREARALQKAPPQPTILDYYRRYPDRYIRVENESWQLNRGTHDAVHSFTLRNLATVSYKEIEVQFTYESESGKELLARKVKIPGVLKGQGTLKLKGIKVADVPVETQSAVTAVSKAVIVQ